MTRQQRLTLVATILGSTIVFLDSTVVNVALPAIGEDLGAGLAGQQWIFEAYLLALVSLLLVGGAMGGLWWSGSDPAIVRPTRPAKPS